MSDSNPTRPTEPIDPSGQAKPTEPVSPADGTSPTEPARPAAGTDAFPAWFTSDPIATSPGYAAQAAEEPTRLPARFGTIFWGVLLFVFAGFMVANAIVPFVQDPVVWLIAGLIAAGAVLVIAGIAAAVRRTG